MEPTLTIGLENTVEMLVTEKDTAKVYGSGLLEVFATPALIAFMEFTAHTSLTNFLPQECTTVGSEINVKHLKATPVGMKIHCTSKLIELEGKRLVFAIEAWDEKAKIGEATHTRFIVDTQKFMEKAYSK